MRNIKLTSAIILAIALVSFSSCGNTEDFAPTHTVGTAGPTSPGAYYFDLTVSPYFVSSGGTLSFSARVTDAAGTAVADGTIVYFSGDMDSGVEAATVNGYAGFFLTVKAPSGFLGAITAEIENLRLTVPYQVVD